MANKDLTDFSQTLSYANGLSICPGKILGDSDRCAQLKGCLVFHLHPTPSDSWIIQPSTPDVGKSSFIMRITAIKPCIVSSMSFVPRLNYLG